MTTLRDASLRAWLEEESPRFGLDLSTLEPASSDAGFRRYFRARDGQDDTFIVMDAPPEHEHTEAFIRVDELMRTAGLNVPKIYAADLEQGFAIMSDLGRETYLDVLSEANAFELMDRATDALVLWQKSSKPGVLPEYDRALLRQEIDLFPEWYVKRHRGVEWDEKHREWWEMTVEAILENNLVYGPVSYDIASLMRDAFITWNESSVLDVTIRYWEKAKKAGIPVPNDFARFYRDVEYMGLQRHLKVLGIFSRLNYRDGKPKYLADTPRFIAYVRQTASRYIELSPLMHLIDDLEGNGRKVGYTF